MLIRQLSLSVGQQICRIIDFVASNNIFSAPDLTYNNKLNRPPIHLIVITKCNIVYIG